MNLLDNFKKPTFVIKHKDFSLLWFEATNQFLVVQGLLKVFFSDTELLSQSDFDEALQYLFAAHPKFKALFQAISADNSNLCDLPKEFESKLNIKELEDFKTSVLELNNRFIRVLYSNAAIQLIFNAPFNHLIADNTNKTDSELIINHHEKDLNLFFNRDLIYKTPKKEFYVLQAQFANKLIEFYHSIHKPRWMCSFHACALQKNHKAFLLLGDSGVGKSTLTALLALSGYRLIADDLVLMDDDLKIYDNPAALSLKENSWAVVQHHCNDFDLPQTSNKTKGNIRIKYLPIHAIQNNTPSTFNVDTIVWVNYSKNSDSKLLKLETKVMLERLIPDTWVKPIKSSAMAFAEWTLNTKALHLTYSDFSSAKSILDAEL